MTSDWRIFCNLVDINRHRLSLITSARKILPSPATVRFYWYLEPRCCYYYICNVKTIKCLGGLFMYSLVYLG